MGVMGIGVGVGIGNGIGNFVGVLLVGAFFGVCDF